jgi:predicted TIM-barrel fold metal-dependent hydrolase
MFPIDYPFESTKVASSWIDNTKLSNAERAAIASGDTSGLPRI